MYANGMQFYCPSNTYPAILLLVLFFNAQLYSIFLYNCWAKRCIKNCSIVKLYNKILLIRNVIVWILAMARLPQRPIPTFLKKKLHSANPFLKLHFFRIFEHFIAVELFLYMGRQIALLSLGMQSIFFPLLLFYVQNNNISNEIRFFFAVKQD